MNAYNEERVNDMFDRIAKGVEGYADVSRMGFVQLLTESNNLFVKRKYLVFIESCTLMVMVSMDAKLLGDYTETTFSVSPFYPYHEWDSMMHTNLSSFDYDGSFMNGVYQGIRDSLRKMVYGDKDFGDGQVRWVDNAGR